jgi:hypothetical protein
MKSGSARWIIANPAAELRDFMIGFAAKGGRGGARAVPRSGKARPRMSDRWARRGSRSATQW